MAIGGYLGTDNSITLPAFESLVNAGKIHYFVAGGLGSGGPGGGPGGGTTTAAGTISAWPTSLARATSPQFASCS